MNPKHRHIRGKMKSYSLRDVPLNGKLALATSIFPVQLVLFSLFFLHMESDNGSFKQKFPLGNHVLPRGKHEIFSLVATDFKWISQRLDSHSPLPIGDGNSSRPHVRLFFIRFRLLSLQAFRNGLGQSRKSGYLLVIRFVPCKKSSHVPSKSLAHEETAISGNLHTSILIMPAARKAKMS